MLPCVATVAGFLVGGVALDSLLRGRLPCQAFLVLCCSLALAGPFLDESALVSIALVVVPG
jgi:hypothetical protein